MNNISEQKRKNQEFKEKSDEFNYPWKCEVSEGHSTLWNVVLPNLWVKLLPSLVSSLKSLEQLFCARWLWQYIEQIKSTLCLFPLEISYHFLCQCPITFQHWCCLLISSCLAQSRHYYLPCKIVCWVVYS